MRPPGELLRRPVEGNCSRRYASCLRLMTFGGDGSDDRAPLVSGWATPSEQISTGCATLRAWLELWTGCVRADCSDQTDARWPGASGGRATGCRCCVYPARRAAATACGPTGRHGRRVDLLMITTRKTGLRSLNRDSPGAASLSPPMTVQRSWTGSGLSQCTSLGGAEAPRTSWRSRPAPLPGERHDDPGRGGSHDRRGGGSGDRTEPPSAPPS